jgi:hypothetical protein
MYQVFLSPGSGESGIAITLQINNIVRRGGSAGTP